MTGFSGVLVGFDREMLFEERKREMSERALHDALLASLEAADNDDLPDGAWWQVLEDAVTFFNEAHSTNFDPNDTVHKYLGASLVGADKVNSAGGVDGV